MVLALLTLPGELTIHRAKNDGRCGTLLQRTQIIRRFAEFLYYLRIAEVARGRISPPAECHSAGMSRFNASARMTTAAGLKHSIGSPAATIVPGDEAQRHEVGHPASILAPRYRAHFLLLV
jgi:hypothetical protein